MILKAVLQLCALLALWVFAAPVFAGQYYIDFANGRDDGPGTRMKPFKHHPWDRNATGNAGQIRGLHRYVFKKGVEYRGKLIAAESGLPEFPIRIGSDPTWGDGESVAIGSEMVSGGWTQCSPAECPGAPPKILGKIWYRDVKSGMAPRMLFEISNGRARRIRIARSPNWEIVDPDNPRKQWWAWTQSRIEMSVPVEKPHRLDDGDNILVGSNRKNAARGIVIGKKKNVVKLVLEDWGSRKIGNGVYVFGPSGKTRILKPPRTKSIRIFVEDERHSAGIDRTALTGATVWSESQGQPFPVPARLEADPTGGGAFVFRTQTTYNNCPQRQDRYFIENHLSLLDQPNEWFFQKGPRQDGRIFLRLPNDRNPNATRIEAAHRTGFIDIENRKNIVIEDLTFLFYNSIPYASGTEAKNAGCYSAVFRILGDSENITISNCTIRHAANAISVYPNRNDQRIDGLVVKNNRISDIDGFAVHVSNGRNQWLKRDDGRIFKPQRCRVQRVEISSNRISRVGARSMDAYNHRYAIGIYGGEITTVSGNTLSLIYGPGILCYNGDYFKRSSLNYPLIRTQIYGNEVYDAMLAGQDYGAISSWVGGPSYIYNNVVGNAVGYKHAQSKKHDGRSDFRSGCYGIGIYLDQQHKGYVFNNIVWGKNNDVNADIYNSVAINEAQGFLNTVFNNTMFNCAVGLHKGMRDLNRSYYLNNLFLDMGSAFVVHEPKELSIEYDNLAYGGNAFQGKPHYFGKMGKTKMNSARSWAAHLRKKNTQIHDTGFVADRPLVVDALRMDFHPIPDSAVIDRSSKVFVPWALKSVVAEWGFFKPSADSDTVDGQHIFIDNRWQDRWTVNASVQRNDLKLHGARPADFVNGILEDWIPGALHLDGATAYCRAVSENLLNFDSTEFLIEGVVRPARNGRSGVLLSKYSDGRGYHVLVTAGGKLRLSLSADHRIADYESDANFANGRWRHFIFEIDRKSGVPVKLYLDGELASLRSNGEIPESAGLSNDGAFYIAKGQLSEHLFEGEIDFLRISKATLESSGTDIRELHQWEFDGPFLKDHHGVFMQGSRRDIGALEVPGR